MKNMRKLFAILLAVMLIMSLAATVSAADEVTVTRPDGLMGPGSITLKLPATGFENGATYKIYKVFDATVSDDGNNVSYKLVSGKTTAPEGFNVDTAGNVTYAGSGTKLTQADIGHIQSYIAGSDPLFTVVIPAGVKEYTLENIPYGYYYIDTSLGSVVSVDTAKQEVEVTDKTVAPTISKKVSNIDLPDREFAIVRHTSKAEFTITITPGNGAKNYVLKDYMEAGLSLDTNSIVVIGRNSDNPDEDVFLTEGATKDYKLTTGSNPCFTIEFAESALASYKEVVVTYRATVTSGALTGGADNRAELTYGNGDTVDSTAIVYNATINVNKVDENDDPLEGAGFVLKNAAGEYYYYDELNTSLYFTSLPTQADVHFSDAEGKLSFTGLAPGKYYLEELYPPLGYNKADDVEITIKSEAECAGQHALNLTLNQTVTVTNRAGSVLPSTGGMGTTLLYVLGGILVLAAVVLLVMKKRMASAE